MRHLLLLIAFVAIAISAKAEVAQVAILSHGDQITTFQSSNAFAQAVEAAEDGDVITLSSGSFAATDITKNLTIRGAGMMPSQNPTILSGDFKINIDPTTEGELSFEGIYNNNQVSVENANVISLLKCNIKKFGTPLWNNITVNDIKVIQSFINTFDCRPNTLSATFVSSYIPDYIVHSRNNGAANATNCIIESWDNTHYKNCIILGSSGSGTRTFANCISNSVNFAYSPITANNQYLPEIENFFKEDSDCYELKDEYATRFLGNDGTQVGIHGGALPFDPVTTSLKIKRFSVGSRTTADGKLPIEIEIDGN